MKLPQLPLRDLFWLTLVAAILCGWFVHYRTMVWGFKAAHNAEAEMYRRLIVEMTVEMERLEKAQAKP